MPSPVAHSLVAYALHRRLQGAVGEGARLSRLVALIAVSSVPDADFVVGWIAGDANLYHHQASHSLGFCLVATLLLAVVLNKIWPLGVGKWTAVNGILLGSHLLLDALTADTRAPFGQPLLWPLWTGFVQSPVTIFLDVRRTGARAEFFPSLCSVHNLKAVAWEIVLLAPVVLLVGGWRKHAKAAK